MKALIAAIVAEINKQIIIQEVFRTFFSRCEESTYIKLLVPVEMTCIILHLLYNFVSYEFFFCFIFVTLQVIQ